MKIYQDQADGQKVSFYFILLRENKVSYFIPNEPLNLNCPPECILPDDVLIYSEGD